jgi:hypothetical protein
MSLNGGMFVSKNKGFSSFDNLFRKEPNCCAMFFPIAFYLKFLTDQLVLVDFGMRW